MQLIEYSFVVKEEDIEGKDVAMVNVNAQGETGVMRTEGNGKVLEIGIDDSNNLTRRKLTHLARQVITLAKANKVKRLALSPSSFALKQLGMTKTEVAELLAKNFDLANYEFTTLKTEPKEGWNSVVGITVLGATAAEKKAMERGQATAEAVNVARTLANTPGGIMTPLLFAEEAKKAVSGLPVKLTVLAEADMKKLKMGAILGVSQGSTEPAKLIVLEYYGDGKQRPIALVGKGITYDSGGLSLKPGDALKDMHMDMSGGAAVIATIALAAKLRLKKNIVAIVPAAENMLSGASMRPGDVLRSMSGKTIEVLNTDAEGRLVLADALTYVEKFKPRVVIDIATLTGAAIVALGQRTSALFTNDEKLEQKLREAGEQSGDFVWPLPLWEEYEADIKGIFGDVANIAKTRYGGAIEGAVFLHQFAKVLDCPWAHIDIAPRMTAIEDDQLAQGSVGAGVQVVIEALKKL